MKTKPYIFCAIDTPDLGRAIELARTVGPVTGGLKLGLEFFNAYGPSGIEQVLKVSGDAKLFLDFKYHDIPNTVAGTVRAICSHFSPAYLNVHASGGAEMLRAAKEACSKETKLLGVTILTSLSDENLMEAGYQAGLAKRVEQLAVLTQICALDGVVCSSHEISLLRERCGKDFVLMVPGIRPGSADQNDQKRVMAPHQALALGATHLVIGRPITGANDPAREAAEILSRI